MSHEEILLHCIEEFEALKLGDAAAFGELLHDATMTIFHWSENKSKESESDRGYAQISTLSEKNKLFFLISVGLSCLSVDQFPFE